MKKIGEFKNKHRTEWQEFLWDQFLEGISKAKSKKKIKEMLDNTLSKHEKRLITQRIAALALFQEGKSYKEIGEILWLSSATISALKKNVFGNGGDYKSQRSLGYHASWSRNTIPFEKKSWLDELFGNIDLWELIKNPPRPSGTGIKSHRLL